MSGAKSAVALGPNTPTVLAVETLEFGQEIELKLSTAFGRSVARAIALRRSK